MKKQFLLITSLVIIALTGCGTNQSQESSTTNSSSVPSSSSSTIEPVSKNYYISNAFMTYEDGTTGLLTTNYDVATRTIQMTDLYSIRENTFSQSYTYVYNEKNLCTYVKEIVDENCFEKYGTYNNDDLLIKVEYYNNNELYSSVNLEYDNLKRITKEQDVLNDIAYTYTYYDAYTLITYQISTFIILTKRVETIDEVAGTRTVTEYSIEDTIEVFENSIVYDIDSGLVVGMSGENFLNGYMTLNENNDPLKMQWDCESMLFIHLNADFYYNNDGTLNYISSTDQDMIMQEVKSKTYFTHNSDGNVIEEKTYNIIDDEEILFGTSTYEYKELDANTFMPKELIGAIRKGNYINAGQGYYLPTDSYIEELNHFSMN